MSSEERFQAIMIQANSALGLGDGPGAQNLFERAANQFGEHSDAEVGLLRASLLAGDFPQAVAWANLIAGEDPDSTEALALQAFVLDRTGHTELGLQLLRRESVARPDDVALTAAQSEILIERGLSQEAAKRLDAWTARNGSHPDVDRIHAHAARASGDLTGAARWRAAVLKAPSDDSRTAPSSTWPRLGFGPIPVDASVPQSMSSGLVVDKGRRVLTVASVVANTPRQLWVRNGLGAVRAAQIERIDAATGLAVLRVAEPFDAASGFDLDNSARPAASSVGFIIGYAVADVADANYPSTTPGVVVRTDSGVQGLMQMTGWVGPSLPGSPVLDASGRLIGLLRGAAAQLVAVQQAGYSKGTFVVPETSLQRLLNRCEAPESAPGKALSRDEIYGRTQPSVVLVVATPAASN